VSIKIGKPNPCFRRDLYGIRDSFTIFTNTPDHSTIAVVQPPQKSPLPSRPGTVSMAEKKNNQHSTGTQCHARRSHDPPSCLFPFKLQSGQMHSSDSYFSSKVDHCYRQGTAGGQVSKVYFKPLGSCVSHHTPTGKPDQAFVRCPLLCPNPQRKAVSISTVP